MHTGASRSFDWPDCELTFDPAFFAPPDADRFFTDILSTTAWRQEHLKLYGKTIAVPRLTAWYGDDGTGYTYSGIANHPLPWTPVLREIQRAVEAASAASFNSVLLNRYRTGRDSVAWHSDDENEFGPNPVIASVSLGAARTLQFKHKKRKELRANLELTHGSLLLMRGATQHHWLHQIPKTTRAVGERINLTFRFVHLSM